MPKKLTWFSCSYTFEGRTFSVPVEARNWDEVSARLRAIGMTAVVNGEQVAEFDAFPSVGRTRRGLRKLVRLVQRIMR